MSLLQVSGLKVMLETLESVLLWSPAAGWHTATWQLGSGGTVVGLLVGYVMEHLLFICCVHGAALFGVSWDCCKTHCQGNDCVPKSRTQCSVPVPSEDETIFCKSPVPFSTFLVFWANVTVTVAHMKSMRIIIQPSSTLITHGQHLCFPCQCQYGSSTRFC